MKCICLKEMADERILENVIVVYDASWMFFFNVSGKFPKMHLKERKMINSTTSSKFHCSRDYSAFTFDIGSHLIYFSHFRNNARTPYISSYLSFVSDSSIAKTAIARCTRFASCTWRRYGPRVSSATSVSKLVRTRGRRTDTLLKVSWICCYYTCHRTCWYYYTLYDIIISWNFIEFNFCF